MAVEWKKLAYEASVIAKSLLTEQGDIIYASAVGVPAALSHGNAEQVLQSGGHGANPSWVAAGGHNAVTLAASADVLLGLSTQELGLDTQVSNLFFAGPSVPAGDVAPHNMTGASTPPPYVVSGSSYASTLFPWKAFDGNVGTNQYWVANATTGWIKIDMGLGNAYLVTNYTIQVNTIPEPNRAPRDWTLQGSNNDSDWTTIDTVTGEVSWSSGESRNFICDTQTTSYRYFKLNITLNNSDVNYVQVGELFLYTGGSAVPTFRAMVAADLGTGLTPTFAGLTLSGSLLGTGAIQISAGGSNQNVNLTPSGSGYVTLSGPVSISSLSVSLPIVSNSAKVLVSLAYTGATSFRKNLGLETDNSPTFAGLTVGSLSGFLFGTAGVMSALAGTARLKIGQTSRDLETPSGTQTITGVGFQPSAVIILTAIGNSRCWSVGLGNTAGNFCIASYAEVSADRVEAIGALIDIYQIAGRSYAVISSFDSDGFTLTWTKNDSPTGTLLIYYLAIR